MKILLISGHGAGDPGASGCGYCEVDLTRELVNLIAPKLRAYATVDVYNQNRNAYMDVQNGCFNVGSYDYVLEVHFNAYNGKACGTEIYVVDREAGITVEQNIMKHMSKFYKLRDNDQVFDGVKRENFLVINTLKSRGMSGALLETCFIDEDHCMKTYQANKNAIAQEIVDGIAEGFELKKQEQVQQPATQPTQASTSSKGSVLNSIPSDFIRENATFTCTVDEGICILEAPSLYGKQTGLFYEKGESVNYDGYVRREGYVWISWISASTGTRRWMAAGELNSAGVNVHPYGTFH